MNHSNFRYALLALGTLLVAGALFAAGGVSLALIPGFLGIGAFVAAVFMTNDTVQPDDLERQKEDFEQFVQQRSVELDQVAERLSSRQRDFAQKAILWQEFVEYPSGDEPLANDCVGLAENDRQVNAILEAEAARIYEAIRTDHYRSEGRIDFTLIRADVYQLMQQVARVYSPDSQNPLLETSFEQLARAASRICLQTLVLLEQLPIDVKTYNIQQMHSYLRKAIQGYGAYQSAAPWIKNLSRAAYAGRMAAGTNPVTLGAWWLATEVARRGANHVVEKVVDKQAVAVLHDVIAVVGVEVASIYGPGFRHRDPAWVLGTELAELVASFPLSHDSLQAALREITFLPLRSEYDRVYLYRCVADQKSATGLISDSAMLSRPQREQIAQKLEDFRRNYLADLNATECQSWVSGVEGRLDLKLMQQQTPPAATEEARDSLISLFQFLNCVAAVPAEAATQSVGRSDLMHQLPLADRAEFLEKLPQHAVAGFSPPASDPSSPLTQQYLQDLFRSIVRHRVCHEEVQQLVLDVVFYFRQSASDAETLLRAACEDEFGKQSLAKLSLEQLKTILQIVPADGQVSAVLKAIRVDEVESDTSDWCLLIWSDGSHFNAILLDDRQAVWRSDSTTFWQRQKGYVIDDCLLSGGEWVSGSGTIQLEGSLVGGGFRKHFHAVLAAFPSA